MRALRYCACTKKFRVGGISVLNKLNVTHNVLMTIMTIMDYYWVSMSLDQYVDVTLLSAISVVVIRTP